MKTSSNLWQYLAKFFLEWEMLLDKRFIENQNTHFMFSKFFSKIVPVLR
jgi:hypothetical protein